MASKHVRKLCGVQKHQNAVVQQTNHIASRKAGVILALARSS